MSIELSTASASDYQGEAPSCETDNLRPSLQTTLRPGPAHRPGNVVSAQNRHDRMTNAPNDWTVAALRVLSVGSLGSKRGSALIW